MWLGRFIAAAALTSAGAAFGQSTGIAVERFAPAAGPGGFGQTESARVAAPGELWFGGGLLAIGRPLVLRSALTGAEVAVPVRYRTTLDVGAELGLWQQRISAGIGLPLSLWQAGDRLQASGAANSSSQQSGQPLAPTALGDVRLRVKARLNAADSKTAFALLLELTAPGGGEHDFVATSGVTVAPRLLGSFRYRWLAAAANLGVRFQPERVIYQTHLHEQLEWSAAVGAELLSRRVALSLYGEAAGAVNLVSPGFESVSELRGAVRLGFATGSIDLGGGSGFGPLAPGWRAFLLLRTFFGSSDPITCRTKAVAF
jgi:hypothetical protein